ncbi:hypothetical protein [Roseateles sp.]|uniref:hypothetical protein n=1 Tax=Roseateles sp. TaxID=1971397 RepID=UPI003D0B8D62
MLTPPTNRLNELLALGGLALVALGFTVPLQKYHEADVHRIEAKAKDRKAASAYRRYAEKVNEMIRISNEAVASVVTGKERKEIAARIHALNPDTESLGREMDGILGDSRKHVDLAAHLQLLRNLWFTVASACVLGGIAAAFIGFRQWSMQPKDVR